MRSHDFGMNRMIHPNLPQIKGLLEGIAPESIKIVLTIERPKFDGTDSDGSIIVVEDQHGKSYRFPLAALSILSYRVSERGRHESPTLSTGRHDGLGIGGTE